MESDIWTVSSNIKRSTFQFQWIPFLESFIQKAWQKSGPQGSLQNYKYSRHEINVTYYLYFGILEVYMSPHHAQEFLQSKMRYNFDTYFINSRDISVCLQEARDTKCQICSSKEESERIQFCTSQQNIPFETQVEIERFIVESKFTKVYK